ncbi:hypothetical protein F4782DRAFT_506634 [Xylaria castorea]|nr:hypothetical protein F4782DRAFT_506634 [Xylaria castorea]
MTFMAYPILWLYAGLACKWLVTTLTQASTTTLVYVTQPGFIHSRKAVSSKLSKLSKLISRQSTILHRRRLGPA